MTMLRDASPAFTACCHQVGSWCATSSTRSLRAVTGLRNSLKREATSRKLAVLLLFAGVGLVHLEPSNFTPFIPSSMGILYGVYFIFFAYGGFARVAVVAEEVRDARRVVPRAIMFALVVSTIVYILVGVAAVGLVGAAELAKSDSPLVDAVGVIGNPTLTYIVSAGGIAETASVLLTSILGVSRMAFAMARRGELPSVMGKLHHKYNSPYASVLGAGVMMIALILFVDLTGVVAVSTFASLFYYAMANVSALRLKSQTRLYSRYIPIVGLATCLVLLILTEPLALEIGLVCLLGGASYYLVRGIGKPSK